ncbi:hypothetical protein GCM10010965_17290 [Caldalkalibacillus thermarum]|nr:hypothetical protein GCM10010965_17290 [Caldalkalibacillus thermarum]
MGEQVQDIGEYGKKSDQIEYGQSVHQKCLLCGYHCVPETFSTERSFCGFKFIIAAKSVPVTVYF